MKIFKYLYLFPHRSRRGKKKIQNIIFYSSEKKGGQQIIPKTDKTSCTRTIRKFCRVSEVEIQRTEFLKSFYDDFRPQFTVFLSGNFIKFRSEGKTRKLKKINTYW